MGRFCVESCYAFIQQVNSYPTVRGFTAIGTGGDDFVQAMVVAVESVLQHPIPEVITTSFPCCKSVY